MARGGAISDQEGDWGFGDLPAGLSGGDEQRRVVLSSTRDLGSPLHGLRLAEELLCSRLELMSLLATLTTKEAEALANVGVVCQVEERLEEAS